MNKAEYSFTQNNRLIGAENFNLGFKKGVKKITPFFMLIYRKNDLNIARLGLSVPKRNIPKATARNKIKRIVRERFRYYKNFFIGLDIILVAYARAQQIDTSLLAHQLVSEFENILNKK